MKAFETGVCLCHMRPNTNIYSKCLTPSLPRGSVSTGQLTNDIWYLKDTHSIMTEQHHSLHMQPPVTDLYVQRQRIEENWPILTPVGVNNLSNIRCDNSLLFPDDKVQLYTYNNSKDLVTQKVTLLPSVSPLGDVFLRSITGETYRRRYLQVLKSLLLHRNIYLHNNDLSTNRFISSTLDASQNASLPLLASRIIPRSIPYRSILIDAIYLLAYTTPDTMKLSSLTESACWVIQNVPRSIWFPDANGLNIGIRICKNAIHYNQIHSAPVSFLCSYFKTSNLPLDTSPGKESSLPISVCHLRLGLELYILIYKYYLIRKTISFTSAHSLNTELQSLTVHTNSRRLYSQLSRVSTDIQALLSKKAALQTFRESLPVVATRMNQRVQCLKMTLSDITMKILRHQKKHTQNKEYWRAKSVELEQSNVQQRKVQQRLQCEVDKLEKQINLSTLEKAQELKSFEKIKSSIDKLNIKLSTKERDFTNVKEQAREIEQKIADKSWKINELQTTNRRELETSLSAMKTEFNRIDVLLSAIFSENSPTDPRSIITGIQSYVARVSKTKYVNTMLPELNTIEEAITAIQKTEFSLNLSTILSVMQKLNHRIPTKFLTLSTVTGITIQQRTSLIKEIGTFLNQKQSQILASYIGSAKRNSSSLLHNSTSSSPVQSNPDITVVIKSDSIRSKLSFQRYSDDTTAPDIIDKNKENTGHSKGTPRDKSPEVTPRNQELCNLFGEPIPWNLLRYKYCSSWSIEENIIQYLRKTCTLETHDTSLQCYTGVLLDPIIEDGLSKKSDEHYTKSSIANSDTSME